MKSMYYFYPLNQPLQANSVFVVLMVGTSRRERMMFDALSAIAKQNQWTLMKWGDDVDLYLLHESERCFQNASYGRILFRSEKMTLSDIARVIRESDLESYLASRPVPNQWIMLARMLNPSYFLLPEVNLKTDVAQCRQRKNLSSYLFSLMSMTAAPVVALIMLGVLDFVLSCTISWW